LDKDWTKRPKGKTNGQCRPLLEKENQQWNNKRANRSRNTSADSTAWLIPGANAMNTRFPDEEEPDTWDTI